MKDVTFDEILANLAEGRPNLKERFARESGYIPPEVFEAERRKAEAERQKTIQKLNKRGLTDMEIAEFMELDLETIQTYTAAGV